MTEQLVRVTVSAFILITASTGTARAWGNKGHEIVALIAYHELDDNPQLQKQIQKLLTKHPHYDNYLSKSPPNGVNFDDWVVMRAATWPDWARRKPDYHRPTWHYVNKPLYFDADAPTRRAIEKAFSSAKENHGDILTAFPDCRRVVKDATATDEDRAIRLCWIFHLIGDIHQPLHAVAYCNKKFSAGDRGGNYAWVRRKPGLNPTRLHTAWDHFLDGEGTDSIAASHNIRANVAFTSAERKVNEIGVWAEESYDLAQTSAYRFNGQSIDFELDDGQDAPSDAPVLPENYEKEAIKIARKRALLAGLRLADVLKADLPN